MPRDPERHARPAELHNLAFGRDHTALIEEMNAKLNAPIDRWAGTWARCCNEVPGGWVMTDAVKDV